MLSIGLSKEASKTEEIIILRLVSDNCELAKLSEITSPCWVIFIFPLIVSRGCDNIASPAGPPPLLEDPPLP